MALLLTNFSAKIKKKFFKDMKSFAKHLVVASAVLLSAGDARAVLIDFEGLSSMTYGHLEK